jgi:hypothetical protein
MAALTGMRVAIASASKVSRMILVVWLVVMAWLAWTVIGFDSDRQRPDVATLGQLLGELPLPVDVSSCSEVAVLNKEFLVGASRFCESSGLPESAAEFFAAELPGLGWTALSPRGKHDEGDRIAYCKATNMLIVENLPKRIDGNQLSVGVYWSKDPKSPFYCQ